MDELEKKCQQQEEKCVILEDSCDSLQRSVEILNKESTWKYSAQSIPNSHWAGLGFDAEYIGYMDDLVKGIRNTTKTMRKRECIEAISFGEASPENGDVYMLQHDKVLLPHWREFTTALHLCHDNDINLHIQNVQLIPAVMDLLAPALKGKLNTLFLDSNNLVDIHEGIEFIVTCMQSNRQMKEFYLNNSQLNSMKNAHLVLDAIINHPSINTIRLENCLSGEINGYDALCYLLASDKRCLEIDFDRNDIHTRGGTAISDYIASNPPLKKLFLSSNKLDDNDALLIAKALKYNTNLKLIHLFENDITEVGYQTLEKAVYDPKTLSLDVTTHARLILMAIGLGGIFLFGAIMLVVRSRILKGV